MQQLASELSFKLEYLPPYIYEGLTVSSSAIRRAVSSGDLKLAEKMLGRKFSIFSIAIGTIEKSSFEIDVKALCLPPAGTYPVKICHDGKTSLGQGFVGLDSLTVELSSEGQSLNERVIEVLFD